MLRVAQRLRKTPCATNALHKSMARAPRLHGDLNPKNILINAAGQAVLIDVSPNSDTGEGDEGQIPRGVIAYQAPEQLKGVSEVRSEIFSLGSLLYEWLHGAPAFTGNDRFEIYRKIVSGECSPLRSDLTPATLALLKRALALRVEDRFPDMASLHRELSAILQREFPKFTGKDLVLCLSAINSASSNISK